MGEGGKQNDEWVRHGQKEQDMSAVNASSVVSFTQCSPTCGRMPLPALSLWPGRQPHRHRLVGGMRGGGPSSVAPRSRNPPTGHRRDSPISSSLFSHGPLIANKQVEQVMPCTCHTSMEDDRHQHDVTDSGI